MAKQGRFKYAIKFLCISNIPGTIAVTPSVVPGVYQTVINIFNPNKERAKMTWSLCLPGPRSQALERVLGPNECARIDCNDIARDFGIMAIHGLEGFVIVESDRCLDITAVYTAAGAEGRVESIDVEQIRERQLA